MAGRRRVSQSLTIPAATEGWDTQSPVASMSPRRAIVMENFIPRQGYCELRKGFQKHARVDGVNSVETLMAYHAHSPANDRLFAVCNNIVYNATSSSDAASSSLTGLSTSRLEYVNFTTPGGHFLFFVNGLDAPRHWNGTTWATPTITGATASTFNNITEFKKRLYFTANDKLGFYYLPVDSIAGAASYFELGSHFDKGGYLVAIATWTLDGGRGADDHFVAISSRGQVAVFAGSNPSDPADWALTGVFNCGEPVGKRCMCKAGGDIYILTTSGVVPLSKSMTLDTAAAANVAISQRIQQAFNDAIIDYGGNFGWQLLAYPRGTLAIVNVPIVEGGVHEQFVMNTLSGAWCKFKGQDSSCWAVFNGRLFFGGIDGYVMEADTAASDGGTDIVGQYLGAFFRPAPQANIKRVHTVRPVLTTDGQFSPSVYVNSDYVMTTRAPGSSVGQSSSLYWNQFFWNQASWPVSSTTTAVWRTVSAMGQTFAINMSIRVGSLGGTSEWDAADWDDGIWDLLQSNEAALVRINSFDVLYEPGEFL